MSKDIKFWLDRPGVGEVILRNNEKLKSLEAQYAESILANVRASFLQTFGFSGTFEIQYSPTRFRSTYRIRAADAKTGAVLKKKPGWLRQFV